MLTTVKRLFASRKWLAAMAGIIVTTGVLAWGWDEGSAQEIGDKIVNVIIVLTGLFIGATAYEDGQAKRSGGYK